VYSPTTQRSGLRLQDTGRRGHRLHLGRSPGRAPCRRGHQTIWHRDPSWADDERCEDDDLCLSDGGLRHRVYAVAACGKTSLRRTPKVPHEAMQKGSIDVAFGTTRKWRHGWLRSAFGGERASASDCRTIAIYEYILAK